MSRVIWMNILLVVILCLSGVMIAFGYHIFTTSKIVIDWSTATELDTIGYNLYRSQSQTESGEKINPEIIPVGKDPVTTNYYSYTDADVEAGEQYFYRLETIDRQGGTSLSNPIEIAAEHPYEGLLLMFTGTILIVPLSMILVRRTKKQNLTTSTRKEAGLTI